jgi:hypothetical protein
MRLLAQDFDPAPFVGWARNMAQILKQGGLWGVPMNRSAYRFDHEAKRITLVFGPEDELFDKTRAVFGEIGYEVVVDPNRASTGDLPPTDFE